MNPEPPDPEQALREQLAAAVRASATEAGPSRGEPWRSGSLTMDSGEIDRTAVAFNVFRRLLESEGDGVREALYSLLRLTDYRFIGIFRFQGGKATSAVHVDRENLGIRQADEVPDTATYCCYVRSKAGPFITADAMLDARTVSHAARHTVRAYCGLPIVTPEGELIGTLCHYDLVPRDPQQLDFELLLRAASALSAPGIVPPYPTTGAS